ncbi:MAG TPA: hypothetical protein VEO73_07055 [Gemmatimonadales bacterium]|nr:hypothetical protein [Gemmatimonadales bacterium]
MIQGPLPPSGLDPNWVFNQLVPVIWGITFLILGTLGLRWLLHSPVGEAIADGIRARRRRRWGGGDSTGEVGTPDTQRVGALEEQVTLLQSQVAELAERLDFAERVLAERRERKLGAAQ